MPSSFSGVADLGGVERAAQHRDRLVVRLQRHRERMAVLAAVREREARRIGRTASARRGRPRRPAPATAACAARASRAAAARRSRAARARGPPPARRRAASGRRPRRARRDARGITSRRASRERRRPDRSRAIASSASCAGPGAADPPGSGSCPACSPTIAGVRLGGEVAHGRRVPVIAARQPARLVHPLLHDRPLAVARDDERVQVDLEAVGDRRCCRCARSGGWCAPARRRRGRRDRRPRAVRRACCASAGRGRRRRRCPVRARAD